MDYDIIFRLATLLLGIAGAAKILYEFSIVRRTRMREEYRFAREFLSDIEPGKKVHPFLREKGYQAIAGDSNMSGDEIEYLLSLTRPERALRDYVLGRAYLEHFPQSGNLQLKFKGKYAGKWSRRVRMYGYIGMYVVSAFLAFSPLLLASYFKVTFAHTISAFAISASVFLPYAWLSLRAGMCIYRAEKLVAHQDRHTQRILVSEGMRKARAGSLGR